MVGITFVTGRWMRVAVWLLTAIDLAERHRLVDEAADRSLAADVGRHLVATGRLDRLTPEVEARLTARYR